MLVDTVSNVTSVSQKVTYLTECVVTPLLINTDFKYRFVFRISLHETRLLTTANRNVTAVDNEKRQEAACQPTAYSHGGHCCL